MATQRCQAYGGAKVNLSASGGCSPLHIACNDGHIGVVRALLSAGATVDLRDINHITPLHTACDRGHTEVVTRQFLVGGYQARVPYNSPQQVEGDTVLHVHLVAMCVRGYV